MKQKKSFMYIATFLALTIPVTGRFVFGLTLMIEFFFLEIAGILLGPLVKKLKFTTIKTYFIMMMLIALTIFFRQMLVITYTEIALTLGFALYFPPVSIFLLNTVFSHDEQPLAQRLKSNSLGTLVFSFFVLIFYLFRDIAGFGTFTFYGKNHTIYEKLIFSTNSVGIFTYFASISGALVLTGLLIYMFLTIRKKMLIINSRGDNK